MDVQGAGRGEMEREGGRKSQETKECGGRSTLQFLLLLIELPVVLKDKYSYQ